VCGGFTLLLLLLLSWSRLLLLFLLVRGLVFLVLIRGNLCLQQLILQFFKL